MLLQSVIVYSILICIMILCGYFAAVNEYNNLILGYSQKKRLSFLRFEIIFPLILFTIIFGMRYDVGTDYLSYLEMYKYQHISPKIEPLFRYLTIFCKELGWHSSIYFGIIAFIEVFFFFYAFKDERFLFPFLVFTLFMNGDWMAWMNGMRQAIAMCIWIYSIKFITNKKLIKYILWGIVAFLFHRSALLLFIFYPLLRNGKDYFKSRTLQLIIVGVAFSIRSIFNSIYSSLTPLINFYISLLGKNLYSSGYSMDKLTSGDFVVKQNGTGIAIIFRLLINIAIIIYSPKLKQFYKSKRFNIIYFFYFIGIIAIYLFPADLVAITRPFRYFTFFPCIMLAYFLYYLYKTRAKKMNKLLYITIIIIYILLFYLTLYVAEKDSHLWYQFYFQSK